jgi:hypothetical protein
MDERERESKEKGRGRRRRKTTTTTTTTIIIIIGIPPGIRLYCPCLRSNPSIAMRSIKSEERGFDNNNNDKKTQRHRF